MPCVLGLHRRCVFAKPLQIGDLRVELGLARHGRRRRPELLIRVRMTSPPLRAHARLTAAVVGRALRTPRIRRHYRRRHDRARIHEMESMPNVGVLAADS
jgi:hypothetical protein